MSDSDLQAEIDRRLAVAMEAQYLKQAHKTLYEARKTIENLHNLDLPVGIDGDIARLAQVIENTEWRIEKMLNPSIP